MKKRFFQVCSFFLCIALLISMLPMSVFAEEVREAAANAQATTASTETMEISEHSDAYIVDEIVENRTEFSKEFLLSNGLHVAAVYADAVHYETEYGWEEIDNTLKINTDGTLSNTAGVWDVSFPQQLSKDKTVTIEKDGYTLSFAMTGELRNTGLEVMGEVKEEEVVLVAPTEDVLLETTELPESVTEPTVISEETTPAETTETFPEETVPDETAQETAAPAADATEPEAMTPATDVTVPETTEETVSAAIIEETTPAETLLPTQKFDTALETTSITIDGAVQTFAVSLAKASTANVQKIDLSEAKAAAQYEGLVAEKNASQLLYANVFGNTNVQYDLQGNRVKESVILNAYDSSLRGYRYTLNTGDMIPVLYSDGGIELRDAKQENIIMYMPAPYLLDNAKEYNGDIKVSLAGGNGVYTLTYILPAAWLASSDRQWPVVLDPAVTAKPSVINIRDHTVASNGSYSYLRPVLECGYGPTNHQHRFFIKHRELPTLKSSDVIISAWISLCKPDSGSMEVPVSVHKVQKTWESETLTWENKPKFNLTVEDYALVTGAAWYSWNITDIVRGWYSGTNTGMMFKAADDYENGTSTNTWKQFASADNGAASWLPSLTIEFINNNGLEGYWDYTESSAGRAGTGYINNYTGNLVWTREDIGFGGARKPVSIVCTYNANDADNNSFGLGYGWRTNYNQRVYQWTTDSSYYVWEDSDGTDHYFEYSSANTYKDETNEELVLTTNGSGTEKYCIKDKYDNRSYFDTKGRLTKISNNQSSKSHITISYTTSDGKLIDTVTDGAGRVYDFVYTNELLSSISYLGDGTKDLSDYTYEYAYYSDNRLKTVVFPDNEVCTCTYTYNSAGILETVTDIDGYKLTYEFHDVTGNWQPYRVASVTENHNGKGGSLNFEYAHNQTTITDHNNNVSIMQFNNLGDTVSIQDDEGRASFAKYAKNDPDETGKGHQLTAVSKLQSTVDNSFRDGSFEFTDYWVPTSSTDLVTGKVYNETYHTTTALKMTRASDGDSRGLQSAVIPVQPGETVTFSVYVKTEAGSVKLVATDTTNTLSYEGDTLAANKDWTRLQATYTNEGATAVMAVARLLTQEAGVTYLDCAQAEMTPTASRLNLISNGDFHSSTLYAWTRVNGAETEVNLTQSAVPQLDNKVVKITGDPKGTRGVYQTVKVNGSEGDSFVLAGWAKGDSAPVGDASADTRDRRFAIKAQFNYTDGSTGDPFFVHFNTDADSTINWQYAAEAIVAKKAYNSIKISLVYDYNVNTVYFDGIQLFQEEFGSSYTYDDDGNVISVVDLQKKNTKYEYDTDNNLTQIIQDNKAKMTYTYDDYHNVLTAKSDEDVLYSFDYDEYGNNTSVTIGSGSSKITSSAAYSEDHNRIVSTTDALGKVTRYEYDPNTNVLHWVQYPKDTDGTGGTSDTRTEYDYDTMLRMASAACETDTGLNLSAEYTYENDLLSTIQTPSTLYSFENGNFALRESVKAGQRTLATYTYTDRNNYLQSLDYGNGDSVDYTYDDKGRKIKSEYEDNATITYSYDSEGELAQVEDSLSGITTKYFYDLTNRKAKYTETGVGFSNSVSYSFDLKGNMTKILQQIGNTERESTYTYDDDNRIKTQVSDDSGRSYSYDAYGRLSSSSTTDDGSGVVEHYYDYEETATGTTAQVSGITVFGQVDIISYGYTYDDNGNIATASEDGYMTVYTYDSANQLVQVEAPMQDAVWQYTYDDAGNLTSSARYPYGPLDELGMWGYDEYAEYEYTDSLGWGDLLTSYNGADIEYDTIGNPLSFRGWTMQWRHGRQLASMSRNGTTWNFTYNADGLRTKRTSGSKTYTYGYIGDQLWYYKVNDQEFFISWDTNGLPLSITTGGETYYYITNLQGDVTALMDSNGEIVDRYYYTPWGADDWMISYQYTTIGNLNPIRYRGYVYDSETGLYYLQSRYYDPEMGRFINADGVVDTKQGVLGKNMYAYCGNNPINRFDSSGLIWKEIADFFVNVGKGIASAAVFIFGAVPSATCPLIMGKEAHYARNNCNTVEIETIDDVPSDWTTSNTDKYPNREKGAAANAHQNTAPSKDKPNTKFSSPNKHEEVIFSFDEILIVDPIDIGTYNYGTNIVTHWYYDVVPWIWWGNTEDDSSTVWDRVNVFLWGEN